MNWPAYHLFLDIRSAEIGNFELDSRIESVLSGIEGVKLKRVHSYTRDVSAALSLFEYVPHRILDIRQPVTGVFIARACIDDNIRDVVDIRKASKTMPLAISALAMMIFSGADEKDA